LRRFYKPHQPKKYYFTNYRIQAPTLRVIDSKGKQIGVISKEQAIRLAEEKDSDLVLIAPNAQPPVAKIIDFKKFLYQEEKKLKEARKGIKKSTVKDIQLSLFIAPADFERLVTKGKEFLEQGNQIRISLLMRGREITKKTRAFAVVNEFISRLGEVNISKPPKLEGRVIRAVLAKKK